MKVDWNEVVLYCKRERNVMETVKETATTPTHMAVAIAATTKLNSIKREDVTLVLQRSFVNGTHSFSFTHCEHISDTFFSRWNTPCSFRAVFPY